MDSQSILKNKYTVLVAGDVDLSKYDMTIKIEPYIVYRYNERKKIREQAIIIHKNLINNLKDESTNALIKELLQLKLQDIEEMSDEEYFDEATKGMAFDSDGNAISDFNSRGKYSKIELPTKEYALPLVNESFTCLVSDLKFNEVDSDTISKYSNHWDYIMSGSPVSKNGYIETYGNKERYIKFMSEPLYYNAFVSNDIDWLEQGDENQIEWILTFRDRFIKNLPKDTKLTVYNYSK